MQMTNETKPTTMDAHDIATNPEKYGFTWKYRDLNKGRDQKTLLRANVPHFEVLDEQFDTFLSNFPKVVMAAINGTSTVIRGQNVARPFIRANPKASDLDIATHIVRSVLLSVFSRSIGGRTRYIGTDGKEYDSLAQAQAASGNKTVAAISESDLAAQFMADAIDMGVPVELARIKAAEKWPDAFKDADGVDEADQTPDDETAE